MCNGPHLTLLSGGRNYFEQRDGRIHQWGKDTSLYTSNRSVEITLPIVYASANSIYVTPITTSTDTTKAGYIAVYDGGTSSFTATYGEYYKATSTEGFYWQSYGY